MTTSLQSAEITHIIELLDRCRGGENAAWQEFYSAHFSFVYRTARRLGTPTEDCDDVCQETFLRAFRKLDQFETGKLTTWLYRITANVVSEYHRRRRMQRKLAALFGLRRVWVGPARADALLEQHQYEQLVAEVLSEMRTRQREVFVLFEVEGLTGAEIAQRVGCKVGTVWTRLHHARHSFTKLAKRKGMLRGIK